MYTPKSTNLSKELGLWQKLKTSLAQRNPPNLRVSDQSLRCSSCINFLNTNPAGLGRVMVTAQSSIHLFGKILSATRYNLNSPFFL